MAGSKGRVFPEKESGLALVTILIMVALVSVLAITSIKQHYLATIRSAFFLEQEQLTQYILGGEAHARHLLRADTINNNKRGGSSAVKTWHQWSEPFKIEGGTLSMQIEDMQALFNLNSLDHYESQEQFRRLLESLALDVNLVELASDWLDKNQRPRAGGAEDLDYLLAKPPHRAADRFFYSTSELEILSQKTQITAPDALARLRARVVALPVSLALKINVNTADPFVLKAVLPGLSEADIKSILQRKKLYTKTSELITDYPSLASSAGNLTFISNFFRVNLRCDYRGRRALASSLIYRHPKTGATEILARSFSLPLTSEFQEPKTTSSQGV